MSENIPHETKYGAAWTPSPYSRNFDTHTVIYGDAFARLTSGDPKIELYPHQIVDGAGDAVDQAFVDAEARLLFPVEPVIIARDMVAEVEAASTEIDIQVARGIAGLESELRDIQQQADASAHTVDMPAPTPDQKRRKLLTMAGMAIASWSVPLTLLMGASLDGTHVFDERDKNVVRVCKQLDGEVIWAPDRNGDLVAACETTLEEALAPNKEGEYYSIPNCDECSSRIPPELFEAMDHTFYGG